MSPSQNTSSHGSPTSTRGASPCRQQSKSYPPIKRQHHERGQSHEIKLADLMDEDEVRWMSNAESSRSPTPSQVVAGASAVQPKQPRREFKHGYESLEQQRAYYHKSGSVVRIGTPPIAEPYGHARNMTPPLPPLPTGRGSPKSHMRALSEPPAGLTALPQRKLSTISSSLAHRVFTAGRADMLYDYTERSPLPWPFRKYKHGALDIATLARMQRHVLQHKLVEQVKAIGERGTWLEIGVGTTIKEYCQINRDLEYMQQHTYAGSRNDPFLITTARPLESQLLEDAGMARRNTDFNEKDARFTRSTHFSPASQALRRLSAMLLVAAALIAPYLIALLAPTQLARVITVCACIILFAIAATMMSMRRRSGLWPAALTLIYAAALVIFVGVNPSRYSPP